jgi:hypothetical protein
MRHSVALDLHHLANDHPAEVAQMLAGIQGGADAVLWTAAMRASTRGGKCKVGLRPEDQD